MHIPNLQTRVELAALAAFAVVFAPEAAALGSSGIGVESTLDKFRNVIIGGKITYIVMVFGAGIAAISILFGGLQKNWGGIMNWLVTGAILFGLGGLFQFFFGVNVDTLLLP